jgi:hypothetical protein
LTPKGVFYFVRKAYSKEYFAAELWNSHRQFVTEGLQLRGDPQVIFELTVLLFHCH